jgi:putative DNA primase/helicase
LPLEGSDLRWCPALGHPSGYIGPALVALVTHAISGAPLTLHQTWLKADGSGKADLAKPRLLLKGLSRRGGVVRLWPMSR